jgi:hypothetical protein
MNGKMLRIQSLLEAHAAGYAPKHESIEDSLKDLINYASFGVSWLRGKMEGQDNSRDMFNIPIVKGCNPVKITADSDHIKSKGYAAAPVKNTWDRQPSIVSTKFTHPYDEDMWKDNK